MPWPKIVTGLTEIINKNKSTINQGEKEKLILNYCNVVAKNYASIAMRTFKLTNLENYFLNNCKFINKKIKYNNVNYLVPLEIDMQIQLLNDLSLLSLLRSPFFELSQKSVANVNSYNKSILGSLGISYDSSFLVSQSFELIILSLLILNLIRWP